MSQPWMCSRVCLLMDDVQLSLFLTQLEELAAGGVSFEAIAELCQEWMAALTEEIWGES